MKKLSHYFHHLNLGSRIWIATLSLILILILIIAIFSEVFLRSAILQDSYQTAKEETAITVSSFEKNYYFLMNRLVQIIGTSDFGSILKAISGDAQNYASIQESLQEYLNSLTYSHFLVDSVILVDADLQSCYYPYSRRLNRDGLDRLVSQEYKKTTGEVSIGSAQKSIFSNGSDVLPLRICLNIYSMGEAYIAYGQPQEQGSIAFLYLLLDADKVMDFLIQSYGAAKEDTLFLTDADGKVILSNAADRDTKMEAAMEKTVSSHSFFTPILEGDTTLLAAPMTTSGLCLATAIPQDSLLGLLRQLERYLLYTVILAIVILCVFSFLFSRYVSRPIKRLASIVHDMEKKQYTEAWVTDYDDEVSQLNTALNTMYWTIQEQIEQIRVSERAKYRAEVQLLAEQINPHFLYNTLEYIDLEILNRHPQSASSMIRNLSSYLRIGLSYGSETLPISTELEHVQTYINIMNNRFHHTILFQYRLEQISPSCPILKSLFQPLAENSIRHGFSLDSTGTDFPSPTIEIVISQNERGILIEVADNGAGIDIPKAERILHGRTSEDDADDWTRHVGLNNIWRRLCSYYTDVSVWFSSIPFFRNSVFLQLPPPKKDPSDG